MAQQLLYLPSYAGIMAGRWVVTDPEWYAPLPKPVTKAKRTWSPARRAAYETKRRERRLIAAVAKYTLA